MNLRQTRLYLVVNLKYLKKFQQLLDTIWSRPKLGFALFGFIRIAKKSGKYRKKIVKVFARFSENVLNFCRPHPTSVVGANFCGCIFCDPCSEKSIKKLVKKKSLCLLEKSGKKFRKKEKSGLFACSVSSFDRPLFSPCCATSRHVLASTCDLYFGSRLNNRYSALVNC